MVYAYKHGHVLAMATQKCLCAETRTPCYLNGFSVLLFVPPAPLILA